MRYPFQIAFLFQFFIVLSNSALAEDSDGDGISDLDEVQIYFTDPNLSDSDQDGLSDGIELFPFPSVTEVGLAANGFPDTTAIADLDGDGDLDIVDVKNTWINDGTGSFTVSDHDLNFGAPWGNISSTSVADLDADGDIDFLIPRTNGTDLIYYNDGTGNFVLGPQQLGAPSRHSNAFGVADIDADGDLDLVSVGIRHPAEVYLQSSSGFEKTNQVFDSDSTAISVAMHDLDSDGDVDFILSRDRAPDTIWLNNGQGEFFKISQSIGTNQESRRFLITDLDGDSDDDLLQFARVSFGVWLNDGSGNFIEGQMEQRNLAYHGAVVDVDKDGDIDFITSRAGLWINDGQANFSEVSLTSRLGLRAYTADFNGDSDAEILISDFTRMTILYLNRLGTDPNDSDSDDDGVPDGREDLNGNGSVDANETDPRNPDSNNNGILDGEEDTDGDGSKDATDLFPRNPEESLDTDSDGIGNNADSDDDGDGVLDSLDAFPLDASESLDSDGDGIGDNSDRPVSLTPDTLIKLPIVGKTFTTVSGDNLTVPSNATAVSLNVTAVNPEASGYVTVYPCGVPRPVASNVNYVAGDVVPNGVIASLGEDGSVCFFSLVQTELVVDVAGWFVGDSFVGATPIRLVDSRIAMGTPSTAPVRRNEPLRIKVTDIDVNTSSGILSRVPEGVPAVALNVTAVNPSSGGYFTVYPCDVDRPNSSNVNYLASEIVANGVIAPVSASGEVCLFTFSDSDVVVDLAGWFTNGFTGATPKRLIDTRDGTGGFSGTLPGGTVYELPVHGVNLAVNGIATEIPSTATAVALNVTAVSPLAAGFMTVYPCGESRPNASNVNYIAGDVVANNVIAPVGDNGAVCIFTSSPSHLVLDISGWFDGSSENGLIGVNPKRVIDTRFAIGPPPE